MVWLFVALCVASAVLHLLVVVPRLPAPELGPDEPPPGYPALATWPNAALLGVVVLGCAQVLHLVEIRQWGVWLAYLGAGGALALVDLRTTYLPRVLNHVCLAQVLAGLAAVAVADWAAAVAALAGGLAAYALFHLVWRFSATFGYGDVRLAGIVGVVAGANGPTAWATALLCGTIIGAVWGIVHAFTRRSEAPAHFPYGPALWLGPVAAVAWDALAAST